jgi:aminopeptidase-like protein
LSFVRPEALTDSLAICQQVVAVLEGNAVYRNTHPKGEPQLGRRGLYRAMGGDSTENANEMAVLWVLNLSDGRHSLLDIAERGALPFSAVRKAANMLVAHDLLSPADRVRSRQTRRSPERVR